MDSANANSQNTDEKLSAEEFRKLIPHLDQKQIFLIEFEYKGAWKKLAGNAAGKNHVNCRICSQDVLRNTFKVHIEEASHVNALNKMVKFFHPLYTKCLSMPLHDLLEFEFQWRKSGKWQKVISQFEKNFSTRFICNICDSVCMNRTPLNAHLRGKQHCLNQKSVFALRSPQNSSVDKNIVLSVEIKAHTKEIPSNIVTKKEPPKTEGPVEQEGLIGVEYVARIKKTTGEYLYACFLCNFNQTFKTEELMEDHLISFVHRRAYYERHYPDTIKHFKNIIKLSGAVSPRAGMTFLFSKLAAGIEEYHGYGRPYELTYDSYMGNRMKICLLIKELRHSCQDYGPSFTSIATTGDLIALKNSECEHISPVKTITARFMTRVKGKFHFDQRQESNKSYTKATSTSSEAQQTHGKRGFSKSSSTRSRSPSPHSHLSRKRRQNPLNENDGSDIWNVYRRHISEAASGLEQQYHNYQQHPEKHPNYEKEWNMFWERRKNELYQEGIDHRSYDFQSEWTAYFRQMLEQTLAKKLYKLKAHARRELNIPLDIEEDSPLFRAERSPEPAQKKRMPQNLRNNVMESVPMSSQTNLNQEQLVPRTVAVSRESYAKTSIASSEAQPIREKRSYSKSSSTRSRSPFPHSHHSHELKHNTISAGDGSDVWATYRRHISKSASELEQLYHDYRQHPEKHPNYDEEWSMFWKRRKNELYQEGIDHRSYDFQPEWTAYFRHKLEQMFAKQLCNLKIDIRRKLNIPIDIEEDSPLFQGERPLEGMPHNMHVNDMASIPMSSQTKKEDQIWNPPPAIEQEQPNIIGMLRLMSALDDYLGSTDEKILDLLTKALSLEKTYGADSVQLEENILNANNCRLLKMAQEKLKSQLYANLVANEKINIFNRVIESAEYFLNRADSMGWSSIEEPNSALPPSIEIGKLIEVLQEKTKQANPVAQKKSLTDTLMELMTHQKDSSHTDNHVIPSNQFDQSGYGFDNNPKTQTYSSDFTSQNSMFLLQNPYATNTLHSNSDVVHTNSTNFQSHDTNSGVWNRLGSQSNYPHRISRSINTNEGESNNLRAGRNTFDTSNSAYGSRNANGISNYNNFNY